MNRRRLEGAKLAIEETEFPPSLGNVAPRDRAVYGITRFEKLTHLSERELLSVQGVGPKSIRILREELASRGLSFPDG